jgi:hypothetical protein
MKHWKHLIQLLVAAAILVSVGCQTDRPTRDTSVGSITATSGPPDSKGDGEAKRAVSAAVTAAVSFLALGSIEDLHLRDVARVESEISWIADPGGLTPTTEESAIVAMVSRAETPFRYFLAMGPSGAIYCGAVSSVESQTSAGPTLSQVSTRYGTGLSVPEAIDACRHRRFP